MRYSQVHEIYVDACSILQHSPTNMLVLLSVQVKAALAQHVSLQKLASNAYKLTGPYFKFNRTQSMRVWMEIGKHIGAVDKDRELKAWVGAEMLKQTSFFAGLRKLILDGDFPKDLARMMNLSKKTLKDDAEKLRAKKDDDDGDDGEDGDDDDGGADFNDGDGGDNGADADADAEADAGDASAVDVTLMPL